MLQLVHSEDAVGGDISKVESLAGHKVMFHISIKFLSLTKQHGVDECRLYKLNGLCWFTM